MGKKATLNVLFLIRKNRVSVGIDFSHQTLKRYKTSLNHARVFIKSKYNKEYINIIKLDYEIY